MRPRMVRKHTGSGGSPVQAFVRAKEAKQRSASVRADPALNVELDMLREAKARRDAELVDDARRRAQRRAVQRKLAYERKQRAQEAKEELEKAKKWVQRDRRRRRQCVR